MSTPEADRPSALFAQHLQQLRETAGRPTLNAVATRSGYSRASVSQTVNGTTTPSDSLAEAIVVALGGVFDDQCRRLLEEDRRLRTAAPGGSADTTRAVEDGAGGDNGPGRPSRRGWTRHGSRPRAVVAAAVALVVAVVVVIAIVGMRVDQGDPPTSPLVVKDVGPEGLIVRSSGLRTGFQVGSVASGQTLWALCQADTGFNPRPDRTEASRWFQVAWPTDKPQNTFVTARSDDTYRAWVFGYFVRQAPGSPAIPTCT